jgi:hypothetical protein
MPRPGFYNDNEYRAYPFVFVAGQADLLPNSAIVDCGVIMGLDSEFNPEIHAVRLSALRRIGNVFKLELRTDAPGAANLPLVFTRNVSAAEWQTEYVESAPYVKDANSCATEPAWSGFLVTGPLTDLQAAMPTSGEVLFDEEFLLEPGRVQSLVKSYLRSITAANLSRPEAKSSCVQTQNTVRTVITNFKCIDGNIRFREGYNAIISQRTSNNEISIGAGKGYGQKQDSDLCAYGGEVPFYTGESPPEGSMFLSGGPACDELVSSINGVQGPDVTIAGGTGVEVAVDAENPNTIKISLSTNNIAGNC